MWSYGFFAKNKQFKKQKQSYDEYIENPVGFKNDNTADKSIDVEIEMAKSIDEMRAEFNKTTRRLKKLYSVQESDPTTIKPIRAHSITNRRATA